MSTPFFPPGSIPPLRQIALQFREGAELGLPGKEIGRDVSALAVAGRTLFCACDETSTVERLIFDETSGRFAEHSNIALSDFFTLPGGPEGEMDIEGLAVEDGALWITGSHSLKRHGLKSGDTSTDKLTQTGWDPNRGFLGRLPLAALENGVFAPEPPEKRGGRMMRMGKKGKRAIRKLLEGEPLLKPFMNVPSKENGFDVEGLALVGGRLVLGLRGPVVGKTSLLVSMRLVESDDGMLEPVVQDGRAFRLHSLDLGGFGIRDLLADGDRLLVLAGPTQAIEGVQRIFAIEKFDSAGDVIAAASVSELLSLPLRRGADHAEGLARFTFGGEDLLLVDYDSPADDRYDEARHELLIDAYPFPASAAA